MLAISWRTLAVLREKCLLVDGLGWELGMGHKCSDVDGLGWVGLTE